MIVLGINGFKNEHDPAAALIINGKMVGFAEEERFVRIKHALNYYPHNAVNWLLTSNNIDIDEIDIFAFGWDIKKMITLGYKYEFSKDYFNDEEIVSIITGQNRKKKCQLIYVPHHLAHAAASFYASGMKEANIIIADGSGEDVGLSCFHGRDNTIHLVRDWNISCSLGFFYEAASIYSGFTDWDAGKTMGLSSFANEEPLDEFIRWENQDIVLFNQYTQMESVDLCKRWILEFEKKYGNKDGTFIKNHAKQRIILSRYAYAASAAQNTIEKMLFNLANYMISLTNTTNLCLGGGVALNCAANGKLLEKWNNIYIFPAANDAGVAFGAAAYASSCMGQEIKPINCALVGPQFNFTAIKSFLDKNNLKYHLSHDLINDVADELLQGKTVGWFQGKMEMGPRALGARSIISLPFGNPGRDKVNNIKGRELWRPFAPSLLEIEHSFFFEKNVISRFMLFCDIIIC